MNTENPGLDSVRVYNLRVFYYLLVLCLLVSLSMFMTVISVTRHTLHTLTGRESLKEHEPVVIEMQLLQPLCFLVAYPTITIAFTGF